MFESFFTISPFLKSGLDLIFSLAFIWAPILLVMIAWNLWIRYVNEVFLSKIDWVQMEIRIPKDVYKSPMAMELVLQSLYQTGGFGTWYHKYWLGNLPFWHSLEIVSIDGKVFFFVRTPKRFKDILEAQIYAQYPQAEINEVPDYTLRVPPQSKDAGWSMWGTEFALSAADPIPIKTYVDYGLDRAIGALKEEERIDPLTPTLEFMGSLKEGEQLWLQILIRPSNWARYEIPDPKKPGSKKKVKWTEMGKVEIQKIIDKYAVTDDKGKKSGGMMNVPKGEMNVINAIEKNITKLGFDAGIRAVYFAKKDKFNASNISALLGTFRQFSANDLNGFKPQNPIGFDYPWQDMTGQRAARQRRIMFNAYRMRSYFYPPYERKPFVLSVEELATIFHFPGRVAETPSFKRIDSKKGEPPINLPL